MPFPFHKILFVVFSFESREFGYCRLSLPRPGRLGHGRQAPPSGHSDILDPLSWGVAHSLNFIPPLTALVQRQLNMLPVMGILRVSLAI
jgi:hypothetical protein